MSGTAIDILAAGEDPTVKIVVGVVIAVFWIISQIFGALSKKPDRRLPPSGPPLSKAPPPLQRSQRGNAPPVPPRIKRKAPTVRSQPMRMPPQPAPTPVQRQPMFKDPAPRPAPPKALPRRQMLGALLKPRNLKKAYVLTEILQPPLSLRESPGRGTD